MPFPHHSSSYFHSQPPSNRKPTLDRLRSLSSLLRLPRLGTPQLRRRRALLLTLRLPDRRRAGHGLGAQVGTVALLGRRVDDRAVQLAWGSRCAERADLERLGRVALVLGQLGVQGDGVGVGEDADGLGGAELLAWARWM